MLMNRDQISEQRLELHEVKVPWIEGGEIMVRQLPLHVQIKANDLGGIADAYLFSQSVCDKEGNLLWSADEAEEIGNSLDPALIKYIAAAALELSQIPKEKEAAIKKNWPTLFGDESGESQSASDSPTQT